MGRKRAAPFDSKTFLAIVDGGKHILKCRKKQALFLHGEPADAVFYLIAGKVKLTVLSSKGKEAVIAILGQREFFGEACLTGQLVRTASATALEESICYSERIESARATVDQVKVEGVDANLALMQVCLYLPFLAHAMGSKLLCCHGFI